MPRPCKRRRVCALPGCRRFVSAQEEGGEPLVLTVDEYEAVRLMDLVGLTQEEAAGRMGVARATVQAIYGSARRKLALFLAGGRELRIAGGQYELCPGPQAGAGCPHCMKKRSEQGMKIAVTYENGQVFQHFGKTQQFKVYTVEDGKVAAAQVVDTNGTGHGALAGFLRDLGVETLICGGIGGGAQTALRQAGVEFYGGVSGSADQAVEALLGGTLAYQPNVMCSHHGEGHTCGHGEGHACGGHGCHQG